MKIRMTASIQGSLDGVTVIALTKGMEYDTVDTPRGERLAMSHIRKGAAVAVAVAADPERAEITEPEHIRSSPKPKRKR